jgi:hypothetical protein
MEGANSLFAIVLQYGLAGVCIIVLAISYYRKDKRCDELQNSRVEESKAMQLALSDSTAAVNRICDLLNVKKGT